MTLRKKKSGQRRGKKPRTEDSNIVSESGYELGTGTATTPSGMFGKAQLSSRRELVEQLDSEPLFDYLVQNGALEMPMVEELRNEKSSAKVNLALLKHLENNGKAALNLFINALRQTGQHHLASLLDDSQRIKALSGSGYLSKKRHKGQVSLQIDVRAIRFLAPHEATLLLRRRDGGSKAKNSSSSSFRASREWVSLGEIQYRILELTEPQILPPDLQQADSSERQEEQHTKASCLCMCFSGLFSRRKGQDQLEGQGHKGQGDTKAARSGKQKQNGFTGTDGNVKNAKFYRVSGGGDDEKKETAKEEELRNLRNLEDTFRSKVKELFVALKDQTPLMGQLSKYFEQDRGVLVLETNCENGLVIINICMKLDQLEQLRRDYSNGKLTKDLENCIVTEQLLQKVGLKGLKLQTDINQDEFELAEQELN